MVDKKGKYDNSFKDLKLEYSLADLKPGHSLENFLNEVSLEKLPRNSLEDFLNEDDYNLEGLANRANFTEAYNNGHDRKLLVAVNKSVITPQRVLYRKANFTKSVVPKSIDLDYDLEILTFSDPLDWPSAKIYIISPHMQRMVENQNGLISLQRQPTYDGASVVKMLRHYGNQIGSREKIVSVADEYHSRLNL